MSKRNAFSSLADAKVTLEEWQVDYNRYRPHSGLKILTPTENEGKKSIGKMAARAITLTSKNFYKVEKPSGADRTICRIDKTNPSELQDTSPPLLIQLLFKGVGELSVADGQTRMSILIANVCFSARSLRAILHIRPHN